MKRNNSLIAIAFVIGCIFAAFAHADQPPQPKPDPLTNAELTEFENGPILRLIEERIEAAQQRAEERQMERMSGVLDQIKELRADRDGLFKQLSEAREERKGIIASLVEMRAEREGILTQLKEARQERQGILASLREWNAERPGLMVRFDQLRQAIADQERRWTPVQDLFDRINGLITKLIWSVVLLFVLFFLGSALFAIVYRRMLNTVDGAIARAAGDVIR